MDTLILAAPAGVEPARSTLSYNIACATEPYFHQALTSNFRVVSVFYIGMGTEYPDPENEGAHIVAEKVTSKF